MAQLVECVPNFSEGRDQEVLSSLSSSISSTPGVSLLDVDAGASTNRTVFTFVGPPAAVVEAALNAARCAHRLIDMRRHQGEHPRLGAMDVCPFVPLRNASMEDCVRCAEDFGRRLAEELNVPVYLYGEAARSKQRKKLPTIRAGEYEGLPDKLKDDDWSPDFGPSDFVASWGATVTGARSFLVAYNVNVLGTKEQAHRVALNLREQGRGKDQPGRLRSLQALGWYLEEENLAQVSTNILDHQITPLHTVYEEVCKDAQDLKLPVVGSQLVGLVPLQALLDAADFYIQRDRLFILEEEHKVRLVISKLGLDSLGSFNPKERIIEYMVPEGAGPLASLSLRDFVRSVAERSPAPGGGSVSAAIAAMGAGLAAMVGQLTYGKKQFDSLDAVMRRLIPPFHRAAEELLDIVDRDTNAFNHYMEALKMPRSSEEEVKRRDVALQAGLRRAVSVPLALAERISALWLPLRELVVHGNIGCLSDAQVAAKALEAGVFGAYYNVLINLKDVTDLDFKTTTRRRASELLQEATESTAAVLEAAESRR